MKRCIVVSDSFKGTLSSREICAIAAETVAAHFPRCEVVCLPVADGGEGTTACFAEACGGQWVTLTVRGALGEEKEAAYLRLPDGTAVVEMAAAAGLPPIGAERDPLRANTYGVGQLMAHAADSGCRRIILGLGGSATNDGGCGCAAALGVVFTDSQGEAFIPSGGTLHRIAHIDPSAARQRMAGVELVCMCDIQNPMHGPQGAAFVFAPQKGADAATVKLLDENLKALDAALRQQLGAEVSDLPGGGAAGGFGAGMAAFFGAALRSGIDTVLDTVDFDKLLEDCDVVFTGEGRVDDQTMQGKVICGVARRAEKKGVPVVVIAGGITPEGETLSGHGVAAQFAVNRLPLPLTESAQRAAEFYRCTLDNILRLMTI